MDTPDVAAIRRLVEMRIRTGRAKGNRVISLGIRDAEALLLALDAAMRELAASEDNRLALVADVAAAAKAVREMQDQRDAARALVRDLVSSWQGAFIDEPKAMRLARAAVEGWDS